MNQPLKAFLTVFIVFCILACSIVYLAIQYLNPIIDREIAAQKKYQAEQAASTIPRFGDKIVRIDGCQYIEVYYWNNSHPIYSLTHKGDCDNPIHKRP